MQVQGRGLMISLGVVFVDYCDCIDMVNCVCSRLLAGDPVMFED